MNVTSGSKLLEGRGYRGMRCFHPGQNEIKEFRANFCKSYGRPTSKL